MSICAQVWNTISSRSLIKLNLRYRQYAKFINMWYKSTYRKCFHFRYVVELFSKFCRKDFNKQFLSRHFFIRLPQFWKKYYIFLVKNFMCWHIYLWQHTRVYPQFKTLLFKLISKYVTFLTISHHFWYIWYIHNNIHICMIILFKW